MEQAENPEKSKHLFRIKLFIMKKKMILTAIAALLVIPFACDDTLTAEDAAKKAAKEFCDCYKDNSLSNCEDKLNSNYSSYVNDDDFYTTFNSANDCGVTIYKKTNN